MDSISQGVLGASMGELAGAKRLGNKAVRRGVGLGTLPDLDVFVGRILGRSSFDSSIFHRGLTHSVLFCVLAAPLIGGLIARIYHKDARDWKLRSWISFLCFITHALLDLLTSYGTQMLLPRSVYGYSLDVIAIVDPFWTLPFLGCVIGASRLVKTSRLRRWIAWIGFGYALTYIGMTFVTKSFIDHRFASQLEIQGIEYKELVTYPEIFQQALWRGLAHVGSGQYVEGYVSIFDNTPIVSFENIEGNHVFLSGYQLIGNRLERLLIVTKGYFVLQQSGSELLLYDLRFGRLLGRDPENRQQWMFGWRIIGCRAGESLCEIEPYRSTGGRRLSRDIWDRFWQRVMGER